jgi:hypothetical protein
MAINFEDVPGRTYDQVSRGADIGASPQEEALDLTDLVVKLTAGGMSLAAASAVVAKVKSMRNEQRVFNETGGYRGKNWARTARELDEMLVGASKSAKQAVQTAVGKVGAVGMGAAGKVTDAVKDRAAARAGERAESRARAEADLPPKNPGTGREASIANMERMARQAEAMDAEARDARLRALERGGRVKQGEKSKAAAAARKVARGITPRTITGAAGTAAGAGLIGLGAAYADEFDPLVAGAGLGAAGMGGYMAKRDASNQFLKDVGTLAKYKLGAVPSKARQFAEAVKTGDPMAETQAAAERRAAKPQGLFGQELPPEPTPLRTETWETVNDADVDKPGTAQDRVGSPIEREGAVYSQDQRSRLDAWRKQENAILKNIEALGGRGSVNYGKPDSKAKVQNLYAELKDVRKKMSAQIDNPAGQKDVRPTKAVTPGQKAAQFAEGSPGQQLQQTVDYLDEKVRNATDFAKKQAGPAKEASNARVNQLKTEYAKAKQTLDDFTEQTKKFVGEGVDKVKKKVGMSEAAPAPAPAPAPEPKKKSAIRRGAKAARNVGGYGAKVGPVVAAPAMGWSVGQAGHDIYDAYQDKGLSGVGEYAKETGTGLVDAAKGFVENVGNIYDDPSGGFFPALGYAADRAIISPAEQSLKTVLNIPAIYGGAIGGDPDAYQVYDMSSRGLDELNRGKRRSEDWRDFDPGEYYRNNPRGVKAPGTEGITKAPPSGGTLAKAENQMPPEFNAYDQEQYQAADPGVRRSMYGRTPVYSRDMTGADRETFGKTMYGDTNAAVNPDIMSIPGMYESTDDFRTRQGQINLMQQQRVMAAQQEQARQAQLAAVAAGKGPSATIDSPKGMPNPMDIAKASRDEQIAAIQNMQGRADMREQGNVMARQLMAQEGIDRGPFGMGWIDAALYDRSDTQDLTRGAASLNPEGTRINLPSGIGFPVEEELQAIVGQAYNK